jgi:pimeloyl-ACP methyl ester carboxylesterase
MDDDLTLFEAEGAEVPLPPVTLGVLEVEGARIHYAVYGTGRPVILLHGGMGHSGNWARQVPDLVASGYRIILVDTRGHGRSTGGAPFSYDTFATDLLAVMDTLEVSAPLVGWSDGAVTALALAKRAPERVEGVFYFACNVDPSGVRPFEMTPVIQRCINRHQADYKRFSDTPDSFESFQKALGEMQGSQPNWSRAEVAAVRVPVTIAHAEYDEFIRPEHARYLAETIPGAKLVLLDGVSHFAPLQRPALFNSAVLAFLRGLEA